MRARWVAGCLLVFVFAILSGTIGARSGSATGVAIVASGTLGDNFIISTGAGSQQLPRVAYAEDSDLYLVVWQDWRKGFSRVFGQRISGDGNLMNGNFQISEISDSLAVDQFLPSLAYNGASQEFLVTWRDERDAPSRGGDIYGRRISTSGAFRGGDLAISTAPHDQAQPVAACNSQANECLVVWTDNRDYFGSGADVWGQRVGGGGSLLGENLNISGAPGDQARPAVAFDSSMGRFLVVWHDDSVAADGYDIRGQLVAGDGTLVRGNFIIASAPGDQLRAAIAYGSRDKEYLVVWYDFRAGPQADLYEQRVSADGLLLGQNKPIGQRLGGELAPDLAYDPASNNYRIIWGDSDVGSNDAILSVVAAAPGDPVGDKLVMSAPAIQATLPSIAYNSLAREYLAVWQGARDYDVSGYEIYGQRVGTSPTPFLNMLPFLVKNWGGL